MKRTQIYFDDETFEYLKKESTFRHLSVSEVIRESIRERMRRKVKKALKAADKAFGIWKDRTFDVEKRIRSLRKDRKV
ncbi:MAG: CopG family transcriptional regulator [bacterium]